MSLEEQIKDKLNQHDVVYETKHWEALESMLDQKKVKKGLFWWILSSSAVIGIGVLFYLLLNQNSNDKWSESITSNLNTKQDFNKSKNVASTFKNEIEITKSDLKEVDHTNDAKVLKNSIISNHSFNTPIRDNLGISSQKNESGSVVKIRKDLIANGSSFNDNSTSSAKTTNNLVLNTEKIIIGNSLLKQDKDALQNKNSFLSRSDKLVDFAVLNENKQFSFYDLSRDQKFRSIPPFFIMNEMSSSKTKNIKPQRFIEHFVTLQTLHTYSYNKSTIEPIKRKGIGMAYEQFWKNKIGWSIGLDYTRLNTTFSNCTNPNPPSVQDGTTPPNEFAQCLNYKYTQNALLIPINFNWKTVQKGRNSLLLSIGLENYFKINEKLSNERADIFENSGENNIQEGAEQFLMSKYLDKKYTAGLNTGIKYDLAIQNNWIIELNTAYQFTFNDFKIDHSNGFQFGVELKYKFK